MANVNCTAGSYTVGRLKMVLQIQLVDDQEVFGLKYEL